MSDRLAESAIQNKKLGFVGTGNLASSIIRALVEGGVINSERIFISNRSKLKLEELEKEIPGLNLCASNEEVIEKAHVVFLGMKPQDLPDALEPLRGVFDNSKIVISLAAGIQLSQLKRLLPDVKYLVRLMTNTPVRIRQAVVGYALSEEDDFLDSFLQMLLSPLGLVIPVDEGEEMDALTIATASGPGFVFELLQIWQSWLEEYGFEPETAHAMSLETFLGSLLLAAKHPHLSFSDLQNQVTSKKGTTEAGLRALREQEVENAFSSAFEKAVHRSNELAREVGAIISEQK